MVFYGDKSNWWACYAFWAFKLFGHADCRVLNGGRKLWLDQKRPTTHRDPQLSADPIQGAGQRGGADPDLPRRGRGPRQGGAAPDRRPQPQGVHRRDAAHGGLSPGGALRGGHIPGAKNVPWSRAVNEDGTFKSAEELKAIYESEIGLKPSDNVVAYCRIGERSSLTWFVLTYLLGYPNVRNYDGSWTEWGNLVRAPIAKGA